MRRFGPASYRILVLGLASIVIVATPTRGAYSQAPPDAPDVAPSAGLASEPLVVSIDGVTRAHLQQHGYEIASGTIARIQRPDARHTIVVVAQRSGGARRVRIEHPAGFPFAFSPRMEFEVEVGERRSGIGGTYRPYAAVRSNGRTLVNINADPMYDTDLHIARGPATGQASEDPAMRLHEAAVRAGGTVVRVAPRTWTRVVTPTGSWLVWQLFESIRPDAAPPPPDTPRTARNDSSWARVCCDR